MSEPQAKDLTHLFSVEAKSRKSSPLKSAFIYYGKPGMTFLGGGLPLAEYFPFETISAKIPKAPFPSGIGSKVSADGYTDITIDKVKGQPNQIELARSLQYGFTEGHTEIMKFVKEHHRSVHGMKYKDWDVIATAGNTESWDSVLRTFTGRGETIFVEEHTFSSALETCNGLGVNTFPVPMDTEGILPDKFEELLNNWVGPIPKLLYTIPTGQNPTGSCLSGDRRKKIYELACKHDFLIIEDEPYFFLQMETYTRDKSTRAGKAVHDHKEFIEALVPSFISMDVEGRVLRLDSFSKVLAPGVRFGWIVGQETLLERIVRLHEVSIQNPSGFTQSLVNGLLYDWGQSGYIDWLIKIREEYTHKRDVCIDAIYDFLPLDYVSFVPPVAGMFFTVYFDASKHPKFEEFDKDVLKIEKSIYEQGLKQGCLMIPGSWFKVEGNSVPPQTDVHSNPATKNLVFFRGTYAAVPLDDLVQGIEKFGKAVRIEYALE
ncbi:Aromatic/aminoadipate aminotransferase 1 [Yamadazyma tenuis]|uniref:aromatic-amino-acid transaminase n=1 Tax=Candida tenuis (strain ATCC 10573 / BCRC 21748 / CBS 615 / JCM 9827 / NBRC 10315 / NRRL Y-1498 / VKM Y-70) TaxID=590646 RepID=G3B8V4_CANTC|nr:aromatic amino acid aminotransferase [Yamadazyma tenuis ATCC 10573]EGV61781.1 aromatic amino acid aminotransferase [Yamadazyma tenuis ATCC 10573]WEJ93011.1 Aromatic/aminoadipate aminotransferase 1 [Yamadazyma tenuis]